MPCARISFCAEEGRSLTGNTPYEGVSCSGGNFGSGLTGTFLNI